MDRESIDARSPGNILKLEELQYETTKFLAPFLHNKINPCQVEDYYRACRLDPGAYSVQRVPFTYEVPIIENMQIRFYSSVKFSKEHNHLFPRISELL